MTTRLETLLERMKKFDEEKAKLEGEISAVKAVDAIGTKVADFIQAEAGKAKIDIKSLHGKFLALHVGEDGKLSVDVASKATNGNGKPKLSGTTTPTPNGGTEYEYVGTDGQVLGKTVQEAMTALGVPDANRPKHNRYERLSADWKKKILQRPAPPAPEASTPAA